MLLVSSLGIGGALLWWQPWSGERVSDDDVVAHDPSRGERVKPSVLPRQSGRAVGAAVLEGMVRSVAGAPIAGASVCTAAPDAACCAQPECSVADADGHFELNLDVRAQHSVFARAPGYLMQPGELAERRAGLLVFTLEPAARSVRGTVTDAGGGPIEGALVFAREAETSRRLASVVSDRDGAFSFGATMAALIADAQADGYSRATSSLAPTALSVGFVLAPAALLEGRVVADESGEPLAGLEVSASGSGVLRERATAISAADGTFRLEALPGDAYSVQATSDEWHSEPAWVSVATGEEQGVELRARRALTLKGSISVAGEPCRAGGALALKGPVSVLQAADERGELRLQGLVPGRYSLSARCEPAIPVEQTLELGSSLEQSWDLDLGLAARGRVETAAGAPLVGARVGVQPVIDPEAWVEGTETPSHWLVQCVSDASGEFACPGLGTGRHQATLLDRRGERVELDVGATGADGVVLRALPMATIVAALPADAAELASQLVAFAKNATGRLKSGKVEPGRFVFEHLPLGKYRVLLGPSGLELDSHDVTLASDGDVVEIQLTVPPPVEIGGRVLDDDGEPIGDAWVRASIAESVSQQPTAAGAPALSDETGRFSLRGLAPGRYDLKVTTPFGEGQLADVTGGTVEANVHVPRHAWALGP